MIALRIGCNPHEDHLNTLQKRAPCAQAQSTPNCELCIMTHQCGSLCQVAAAQREAAAGFRDVAAVLEQQRAAAEEAAAGTRQDVRNLHLELVRQFHVQQVRDTRPGGAVYLYNVTCGHAADKLFAWTAAKLEPCC